VPNGLETPLMVYLGVDVIFAWVEQPATIMNIITSPVRIDNFDMMFCIEVNAAFID
jgi:hypothetical protein